LGRVARPSSDPDLSLKVNCVCAYSKQHQVTVLCTWHTKRVHPLTYNAGFLWRNRCCTDFLKKKMFHHYYRKSIQMYYRHKHACRLSGNVCYFDQILQDQFTMYFRGPRTLHRKIGVLGANVLKTTGLPYLCFLSKSCLSLYFIRHKVIRVFPKTAQQVDAVRTLEDDFHFAVRMPLN